MANDVNSVPVKYSATSTRYKRIEEGQVFGRLFVIERAPNRKVGGRSRSHYSCICLCGTVKEIMGQALRRHTRSCGCLAAENRIPDNGSAINVLLNRYVKAAHSRGKLFLLSKTEFNCLVRMPCYYCGRLGSNHLNVGKGGFDYNGVDRKENNGDYTVENSVPCCGECNIAKGTMSAEKYVRLCVSVVRNQLHQRGK